MLANVIADIPARVVRIWMQSFAVCMFGLSIPACLGQMRVLVDHVGYETRSPKQALVLGTAQDHPKGFSLMDTVTGKAVLSGTLVPVGEVDKWNGRVFWTADFSAWQKTG